MTIDFMDGRWRVARIIPRNPGAGRSNYKRHIINAEGKPICNSTTRSLALDYTDKQSNCLRCLRTPIERS